MDCVKSADAAMIDVGGKRIILTPRDLLIRGALSGALLGAASALAFTGAVATGQPIVSALIFPVSLVMIVVAEVAGIAARIISVAEAKTIGNAALGTAGMVSVFVMLRGAKVSVSDWWFWNQIPVRLGNLVDGFVFAGLALYATYKPAQPSVAAATVAVPAAVQ